MQGASDGKWNAELKNIKLKNPYRIKIKLNSKVIRGIKQSLANQPGKLIKNNSFTKRIKRFSNRIWKA